MRQDHGSRSTLHGPLPTLSLVGARATANQWPWVISEGQTCPLPRRVVPVIEARRFAEAVFVPHWWRSNHQVPASWDERFNASHMVVLGNPWYHCPMF
ncbi:hypothetical protein V2G26_020058 [Clonostachys chloroleuca]